MKKTLIIAGALFFATASSAFAQGWGYQGGYGGQGYSGHDSYRDYVRQMRACQRHERLHEALGEEHAEEHAEGLDSRAYHRDLHGVLGQAHEAYHEDHPRSDFCDNAGYTSRYRGNGGYGSNPYGSSNYGYGYRR